MNDKYVKCRYCESTQNAIQEDMGCFNCNTPSNWVEINDKGDTIYYDQDGNEIETDG